jgi:hypothetical protein
MSTKIAIAAVAAALTASFIGPASALLRTEHRRDLVATQLGGRTITGAFAAAHASAQSAPKVVSPQGRVLGADPDRTIRLQLARDCPPALCSM